MINLKRLLSEIDYLISDANISDENKIYMKDLKIVIENSVYFNDIEKNFVNEEFMTTVDDFIDETKDDRETIVKELEGYSKNQGSKRLEFIDSNLETLNKLKIEFNNIFTSFINSKLNSFIDKKNNLLEYCCNILGNFENFIYCFNNQLIMKHNGNIIINEDIVKRISMIISNKEEFSKLIKVVNLTNKIKENDSKIKILSLMINNYSLLYKLELLDFKISIIDSKINNLSIDYSFDVNEAIRELNSYKSSKIANILFQNKIINLTDKIKAHKRRKDISDKLFFKKMDYLSIKDKIEDYLKKIGLSILFVDEYKYLENEYKLKENFTSLTEENKLLINERNMIYNSMNDEYKNLFDNEFITMNMIINKIYSLEDSYIAFLILEGLISINDIIANKFIQSLEQKTIDKYVLEFYNNQNEEVNKIKENKKKVLNLD